ncbi:MAG: carbon-nitrogen hydrolase family protein [Chlorobi bacterium]|nr:carbon-nitrogen hydrolase family protein [Chlorobiota bacterium]
MGKKVRVAVIQTGSVLFEKNASVDKVVSWLNRAAREQARLVLFPEAFIPGYPRGMHFGAAVGSRTPAGRKSWEQYYHNAIDLAENELSPVAEAVAKHKFFLSLGIIEKDAGSLYCTQVLFTPAGEIAGKHRKIKPTGTERIIWAEGDGSTLTTFKTPIGILGTLICWENYMPLARMSLYRKGVTIYLAPTADQRDIWLSSMKHIAAEGRCFVLSANQYIQHKDYPVDIIQAENLTPEQTACRGGSVIVSPSGDVISGPLYDREGILLADLDMDAVVRGKMDLDVAGHYNRPDVFRFNVPDQPGTKDIG